MKSIDDEELIARYPGVVIDHDSRAYWEGCLARRLVLARCSSCGHWIHFPRPMCPRCWSDEVSHEEVSGTGTIFSFILSGTSDERHADLGLPPGPLVVAAVELAEQPGLRMPAPVVNVEVERVAVGMPVRVCWLQYRGSPVPAFEPAPATGD